MAAQINYFADQGIRPGIIISYIDQSDLGDEVCRYQNYTTVKYGKADDSSLGSHRLPTVTVRPYVNSGEMVFEYTPIVRLFRSPFSSTRVIAEVIYRIQRKFKKTFLGETYSEKCTWKDISRELKEPSRASIAYFEQMLVAYIDSIFIRYPDMRLYLVTHPHLGNLDGSYRVDVGDIVASQIKKSQFKERIIHLNFSNMMSKYEIEPDSISQIYEKNDLASHLTDDSYKLMARIIVDSVDRDISSQRAPMMSNYKALQQ